MEAEGVSLPPTTEQGGALQVEELSLVQLFLAVETWHSCTSHNTSVFCTCNLALEFHRKIELLNIVSRECTQNKVNFSTSFLSIDETVCVLTISIFSRPSCCQSRLQHVCSERCVAPRHSDTVPMVFKTFWTLFYIDCNVMICE